MNEMYRDYLLDHYKNPRNSEKLNNPNISIDDNNPLCGDKVHLELKLDKQFKIIDVAFAVNGCVMSTASASLLSEAIKGKRKSDVEKFDQEKIFDLIGIKVSPGRLNCVLLPLKALHLALKKLK